MREITDNRNSLYGRQWRKRRALFLGDNPICIMCKGRGVVTLATVVDHVTPHRGDEGLFWDESNWQALCAPDHDSVKQRLEKSGTIIGATLDGTPVDPNHHWN